MDQRKIKVIDVEGIAQYHTNDISNEMAGQKAMGLLTIPKAWRLPFFVISRNVSEKFMAMSDEEQRNLCAKIAQSIRECAVDFDKKVEQIIIRSSGEEEGMCERGKYESAECKMDEIEETFYEMLCELKKQAEKCIAYIVQPYVNRNILGHLSNERRISQYARDWKVEYESSGKNPYSIGVRTWRKVYSYKELVEDNLQCKDEEHIKEELRKVAYYYSQVEKNQRVHLEFVWNGNRVYLVQKDVEVVEADAKNPTEYDIKVTNADDFNSMRAFRRIEQRDGVCYKKVKNVLMYESLGLITAPLYILDDKNIIVDMAKGIFHESVEHDFLLFQGKSVVIRTDVVTEGENIVQLLPRSNELRSYEDIRKWCVEYLPEIVKYERVVLLVHMFIPAISAAFAYAEPNSRVVTVQALWGLPEGLYYNAHDTFLLDTGTKNVEHIDEEKILINSIVKDYKAVYISPDEDGRWVEKKVQPPYDWQKSITDRQAKKIAKGSRLIAQKMGKAISVMWFVGIDEEYYGTDCLPWFHEIYGNDTFSHEIYKKKYFTEKEVVISSEEDLKKYENDNSLRTITIHPKDDKTLRNRGFIEKVGTFAQKNGITIFLEGTILAHPVYALASKGVRIILAKKNKELIERNNFNKLVRDNIPEKIVENMEQIECYKTTGNVLIRYLKEKLVEEIFEICDATEKNSVIEEMADAYEVLLALYDQLCANSEYKDIPRKKELWGSQVSDGLIKVENRNFPLNEFEEQYYCKYGNVCLSVEREHQCIELEITINSSSRHDEHVSYSNEKWKETLVGFAYRILDEKNKETVLEMCKKLIDVLMTKAEELEVSRDELEAVRDKKNKKNGGFYKGFVLHETKMRTETSKGDTVFELPLDRGAVQEEYSELNELLFEPVTYTDYREQKGSELIVRIKYPLCLNKWQNEFVSKGIEKVFGKNARLRIEAKRERTCYSFTVAVCQESYEQLRLLF